jgi:hypothetical protein
VSNRRKSQTTSSARTDEICSWASQLASEGRKLDWVFYRYLWPDAVREIIHKLETMCDGIIVRGRSSDRLSFDAA